MECVNPILLDSWHVSTGVQFPFLLPGASVWRKWHLIWVNWPSRSGEFEFLLPVSSSFLAWVLWLHQWMHTSVFRTLNITVFSGINFVEIPTSQTFQLRIFTFYISFLKEILSRLHGVDAINIDCQIIHQLTFPVFIVSVINPESGSSDWEGIKSSALIMWHSWCVPKFYTFSTGYVFMWHSWYVPKFLIKSHSRCTCNCPFDIMHIPV